MAGLKAFHTKYWEGVRYSEDGFSIQGVGASAGRGYGGGSVAIQGTEEGGELRGMDLNSWPINPDGSLHQWPLNIDGSVTLEQAPSGEGGSSSQRLARALKEEDERMECLEQLDMLGGQLLELDPPIALAFIEPLIVPSLQFVDLF